MGHADHDLVSAVVGSQLDRLVEHRHEHVETFERELLLAQERPAQVLLEPLHLRESLQQGAALARARAGWRKRPDSIALRSHTRSA